MLSQLTPSFLLSLLLAPGICKGFDFTLQPATSDSPRGHGSADTCGTLKCVESVSEDDGDSRTIQRLAVYRYKPDDESGPSKWQQLVSVTSESPKARSDSNNTNGTLAEKAAKIEVRVVKFSDCASLKFACISRLADGSGQVSVVKSVIGGKKYLEDLSELEIGDSGQPQVSSKVETSMGVLKEKLGCIEARLGDSAGRLEAKLEALTERLRGMESSLTRDIYTSGDRLKDDMVRVKERLEDKLVQLVDGKFTCKVENERLTGICANVSSQLNVVGGGLDSLKEFITSFSNRVGRVQGSMSNGSVVNAKMDKVGIFVSNMTRATGNLTAHVSVFNQTYVEAPSKPITEVFNSNLTAHANVFNQTHAEKLSKPVTEIFNSNLTAQVRVFNLTDAEKPSKPMSELFDVFNNGRREWALAFRGTPYNNVQVYPAYRDGTGIPGSIEPGCKQFNRSLPCHSHYRNNDILDNWAGVDKVTFALYFNGNLVKYITFNGRNSTSTNWFDKTRVIESSWTDLKNQTFNHFSTEGAVAPKTRFRFYVSHIHQGCLKSQGWVLVKDILQFGCSWENEFAFPVFMYAKGQTTSRWSHSGHIGRAHAMAIFVKYL